MIEMRGYPETNKALFFAPVRIKPDCASLRAAAMPLKGVRKPAAARKQPAAAVLAKAEAVSPTGSPQAAPTDTPPSNDGSPFLYAQATSTEVRDKGNVKEAYRETIAVRSNHFLSASLFVCAIMSML